MPVDEFDLSRREFLGRGAAVAGAVAVPGVLAACGGSSSSSASGGGSSGGGNGGGKPRRGGSLKVAYSGGSSSDTLDPQASPTEVMQAYCYGMFEGLTAEDFTGAIVPNLAESVEATGDSRVWTIRVRKGIQFHDGRTLSADDVVYSLKRMVTLPTSTASQFLRPVDPSGIKKLDAQTVQVTLKYPYSIFGSNLAGDSVVIVPEGFDPHKPIGTGPFKYKSFSPGNEAVFTANRDWWGGFLHQTGGPYLDELRVVDINDDNARVNALESGQVDAIQAVPLGQVAIVASRSNLQLLTNHAPNWRPFTMRVDVPPFNDVRVRQALRLIADRPELVSNAYSGHGSVANDLYSPNDPLSIAKALPQRHQDLEQAKSLLKAAGQSDLRVTLTTSAIQAGIVEASQVYASQAAQAGVTVRLNQIDPGVFYGKTYLTYPFSVDYWNVFPYLVQVAQTEAPGAGFNETHWSDPQYSALWFKILKTQDESQRKEIAREMQMIDFDRGGYIIWGYVNTIDAASSRVHGFVPHPSGHAFGRQTFYRFWVT